MKIDLSDARLLELARRRPETLYEMHALAELARRALAGRVDLNEAMSATLRACTFNPPIFGGSAGALAATVFALGPPETAESFWARAQVELDELSLEVLQSAYEERDAPVHTAGPICRDSLMVWTGADGVGVVERVLRARGWQVMAGGQDASDTSHGLALDDIVGAGIDDAGVFFLDVNHELSMEDLREVCGEIAALGGTDVALSAGVLGEWGPDAAMRWHGDRAEMVRVEDDGDGRSFVPLVDQGHSPDPSTVR